MSQIRKPLAPLTDEELVEQVPTDGPDDRIWNQAPYVLEMNRRLLIAIRDFNTKSGKQATVMIRLTVVIAGLTVLIAALTVAIAYLTFVMAQQGGQ